MYTSVSEYAYLYIHICIQVCKYKIYICTVTKLISYLFKCGNCIAIYTKDKHDELICKHKYESTSSMIKIEISIYMY